MSQSNTNPGDEHPKHRWQAVKEGWYSKLNVTVKQLDIVIAVCVVLLIVVLIYGYMTRGYTVEFNSLGGTTVESQDLSYGDYVFPEEPTREGYEFTGWYRDILCEQPWNMATDKVESDMTLYAGWAEITD